ncbi:c-type cytochrome [Burkholderia multivorans]|uniref:c-type cytochrome n=1 Tax=Burkholderia multivorans TaxID=87883 RepID=UPI00209FA077|nr:cytochrome C [Burkholderia multivorans]MCO8590665.1 cytochrome C [Burkholderia multivorans]MCO8609002.1 cytochrome C [Burkholderia multivorans]MCO8632027.1 cytochrome C [Burkholderia multivorans]MCO8636618.1 cytochrome C [Burkholderia multivorans]MCO8647026.1 cytochrome C [Burkholderia multivorans]
MNVVRCLPFCTIAAASIVAAQTTLPEPVELVDAQHCMFCHTSDLPFLGPSFQQIAQRYRGVPNAADQLEHKLRVGGPAHWGDTPMPPAVDRGAALSADDAHRLVQWVLSQ